MNRRQRRRNQQKAKRDSQQAHAQTDNSTEVRPELNAKTPGKQQCESEHKEKDDLKSDWHRPLGIPITEWLVAFFTLVIMASSIVYTIYAKRQWKVMKEAMVTAQGANEIATKTLIEANHSWLEIRLEPEWGDATVGGLAAKLKKMDEIDFWLSFANIGKSPVKQIIIETNVGIVDSKGTPVITYENWSQTTTENILYPGRSSHLEASSHQSQYEIRKLTPALRQDLLSGVDYLIVYARGRFVDDFGQHWIRFCYPLAFKGGDYKYMPCTLYNDAGDGVPSGDPNQ